MTTKLTIKKIVEEHQGVPHVRWAVNLEGATLISTRTREDARYFARNYGVAREALAQESPS